MAKEDLEKVKADIEQMLAIQKESVFDAYSAGMYNGIEAVWAVINNIEPQYVDVPHTPLGERLLIALHQARKEKERMERGDMARYQAIVVTKLEEIFAFHSVWLSAKIPVVKVLETMREEPPVFVADGETISKPNE